ncbi:MAG: hypothetical protein WBP15_05155, partial [Tabrizicola sp.]
CPVPRNPDNLTVRQMFKGGLCVSASRQGLEYLLHLTGVGFGHLSKVPFRSDVLNQDVKVSL